MQLTKVLPYPLLLVLVMEILSESVMLRDLTCRRGAQRLHGLCLFGVRTMPALLSELYFFLLLIV